MKIKSYLRDYEIIFQELTELYCLSKNPEASLIVADSKVYELFRDTVFQNTDKRSLFLIESTEENKTTEKALEICEKILNFSAKRNSEIIAIGGGIIQDLCTFAANLLYRGINLTLIPTTLLAQSDSCIGSKSSINFKNYKNLLGYFYPPQKIYICNDFLSTLTELDFRSGLGEILKINIMAGPERTETLSNNLDSLLQRNQDTVSSFIKHALNFKKAIIEEDEFDTGIRRNLNYGHTFGHALESSSNYEIPHGIAVAMGITIANKISNKRGYIGTHYTETLKKLSNTIIPKNLSGLNISTATLINSLKKDKKRQNNSLTAILLKSETTPAIFHDITETEVLDAFLSSR